MKNLENYGVQELDAKELQGTNGGLHWIAVLGLITMAESAITGMIDGIRDGAAQAA